MRLGNQYIPNTHEALTINYGIGSIERLQVTSRLDNYRYISIILRLLVTYVWQKSGRFYSEL